MQTNYYNPNPQTALGVNGSTYLLQVDEQIRELTRDNEMLTEQNRQLTEQIRQLTMQLSRITDRLHQVHEGLRANSRI